MAFFASKRAPEPQAMLDGPEPQATEGNGAGMPPLVAKMLQMMGIDPAEMARMTENIGAIVADVQLRLTRIELKLDELKEQQLVDQLAKAKLEDRQEKRNGKHPPAG